MYSVDNAEELCEPCDVGTYKATTDGRCRSCPYRRYSGQGFSSCFGKLFAIVPAKVDKNAFRISLYKSLRGSPFNPRRHHLCWYYNTITHSKLY